MRIIHTSDWHIGSILSVHDQTDKLFRQVKQICQFTEQYNVDVLLVAGDIFECKTKVLPELTKHLADIIAPYVRRGLHVILVPGNHDKREHFRMMHTLLALEHRQSKRVHIVQTREIFSIDGVQFAVIPYPARELLEPYRSDATGATRRHVALSSAYANLVRAIVNDLNSSLPVVFVAHINVAGVTTPSGHELSYDEDIRLGTADLPLTSNLAYIALGHIHQPQRISHPVPCYYSGSIDRLNFGEREDKKCVLLVDIPQTGPAYVTQLPLESTPFYEIRLSSVDLETLPNRYPDLERAFVKIHLECQAGEDPVALQRRARELCPRCLDVQLSGEGLSSRSTNLPENPRDYAETVLGYLREIYAEDPDFPELEKRANELLREVSNAFTTD